MPPLSLSIQVQELRGQSPYYGLLRLYTPYSKEIGVSGTTPLRDSGYEVFLNKYKNIEQKCMGPLMGPVGPNGPKMGPIRFTSSLWCQVGRNSARSLRRWLRAF